VGGWGRNRPDFPTVAPQICLILLGIQAKTVLSERIFFNPFGVRFGVREMKLLNAVVCYETSLREKANLRFRPQ